jgi:hypothetical protein
MGTLCSREDFSSSKKLPGFVQKLWMRAFVCGKHWKTGTKLFSRNFLCVERWSAALARAEFAHFQLHFAYAAFAG